MTGLEHYLDTEEREQRQVRRGTFLRLLRYIGSQKALLALGMVAILVGSAAYLIQPWLFGHAIDHAIRPGNSGLLRTLVLLFLATLCVRVVMLIGQAYLFEVLGQRVMQQLRLALFTHMQGLPVQTFDRNPVGRLVTRITNDISALSEMFSAGFISIIDSLLRIVGTVAFLFVLNWRFALVATGAFPVLVFLSIHFTRLLRISYREARSKLSALNAFLAENILGMRVVHLFNRQRLHFERFSQVNQWYSEATIRTVRVYAYFQPSITWISGLSMACVLLYGSWQASKGALSLGILVAFTAYVQALFQPVREIADKWNIFLSGMASVERIFSILDWGREPGVPDVPGPAPVLEGLCGHIRFEGVWFAYEGERWVLRDFSLDIQPGQKIGVVGHTGAGKTTLISLLLRFYEPQRGRILIDGKDIREYDKRSLRAAIGLVQQDVFLFSGSIQDNLSLWRDLGDVSRAQVRRLLEGLGFSRWLGEDAARMELQERGSNLSMGERQVMAFVRALVSRPSLWILDEATANIDSGTEKELGQVLERESRGKTTILIAHRLATVRDADRILVLHRGALLEDGRHAELMGRDGLYARLYRYQSALAARGEAH